MSKVLGVCQISLLERLDLGRRPVLDSEHGVLVFQLRVHDEAVLVVVAQRATVRVQHHRRNHGQTVPFLLHLLNITHRDTHPFNGPFAETTRVSRYQKGKTKLDFTEARDSEWQWHRLGHMQVCTSLQTDNHASTPPLSFLQSGCPSCRPTNSVKALKDNLLHIKQVIFILLVLSSWPGGVMVRVLARDTKGREFDSRPFHCQVTTLGKLCKHVPLLPSSIIWYRGSDTLWLVR